VATGIVTLIVGVAKFTIGTWVPIVIVPVIIVIFRAIKELTSGSGRTRDHFRRCAA
jgi:hypothetical protein